MNDGVQIVLERMKTHPEEFHRNSDKWKFIYQEYFRDAMSEEEKGAIFDRLKQIRKEEFTTTVMATLVEDDIEEDEDFDPFGNAPMKREGSKVRYKK